MAVISVLKSATSWLIETFMTEVSSTMRNWAVPSTASAFHRPTPIPPFPPRCACGPLRGGPVRAGSSDPDLGLDPAAGDRLGEGGVVALVLVGVCLGELHDRPVEGVGGAEVRRDGDPVAGTGVRAGQRPAADRRVQREPLGRHPGEIDRALAVPELAEVE